MRWLTWPIHLTRGAHGCAACPAGAGRDAWRVLRGAAIAMLAVVAVSVPARARAQIVRGHVVDAGSGQPLYGAIVALMDASGAQVAAAISDADGYATLPAPMPGRYRLQARRIGFRSTTSTPFTLAAGQKLAVLLVASAVPVQLATIKVTGKERCTTRPEEGRAAFTLWNEVRKALTATTLTEQQHLVQTTVRKFDRDLDSDEEQVKRESDTVVTGMSTEPFAAMPAQFLEMNGYAQLADTESWYYAPDAHVLLSDAFAEHHCFRVTASKDSARTLIGLGFEPVKDLDVPNVTGTLWLDRRTGELHTLQFYYTDLPSRLPKHRFGGDLDFRRLPTGAWIIQHWVIRMPHLGIYIGRFHQRDTLVDGVHESGGDVLRVAAGNAALFVHSEMASLTGVVTDSISGGPLVHALVFLVGMADSARTDSAGRFHFSGLSGGRYTVAVSHPRLDSLALGPLQRQVALRRGLADSVRLAVPSLPSIFAMKCPDSTRGPDQALVMGTVREWTSGIPVPNALVTVSWKTIQMNPDVIATHARGIQISSDSLGRYHACGVPAELSLTIAARVPTPHGANAGVQPLGVVLHPLHGGEVRVHDVRVADRTPTPD